MLNKVKLFDSIANEPLKGTYTIALEGDKRRNSKKREATLEVRFSAVTIQKNDLVSKHAPQSIGLYIIEAKEIGEAIDNPYAGNY